MQWFYVGLFMQLLGMSAVSLCLLKGLQQGDYGRLELIQFIGGSILFYLGSWVKKK